MLSVGLFADGSYGAGWGGVHKLFKDGAIQVITNDATKVTLEKYAKLVSDGWVDQGVAGGLARFFGGAYNDWSQLGAQLIGSATNFVFVGLFALVWFRLSNAFIPLRSKRDDEFVGLDIPELGAEAYPDYRITDKSSPGVR